MIFDRSLSNNNRVVDDVLKLLETAYLTHLQVFSKRVVENATLFSTNICKQNKGSLITKTRQCCDVACTNIHQLDHFKQVSLDTSTQHRTPIVYALNSN